ncbi:recombinase family protein [Humibacter ginsengiterrae]
MTRRRAAIYCRISKKDPNVPSVKNQEADCRRLADQLDADVIAVFVDDGISATKGERRPDFEDLLERTKAGDFDLLIAKEQSRFERSPMDRERLAIASVANDIVWHTEYEGEIDPANDDDDFMSLVRSGMNKRESRRIARRVRSANDHIVAKGRPIVTKRPFGWEPDGVTVREDEAEALRWAVDHVLDGGSLWSVAKQWNADGITPVIPRKELEAAEREDRTPVAARWTAGSTLNLLRRPRNAGLIVHRGEVVGSGDFGIIDAAKFDLLMAVLNDPGRPNTFSREVKYLMTGIAECGTCGAAMRPTTTRTAVRGGGWRHYAVYRCGAVEKEPGSHHGTVQCDVLDNLVPGEVLSVLRHRAEQGDDDEAPTERVAPLIAQRAELEAQRIQAQEIALMPGANLTHIRQKLAKISNDIDELGTRIEQARASSLGAVTGIAKELAEEVARFAYAAMEGQRNNADLISASLSASETFRERWDALPLEDRRNLVRATVHVVINSTRGQPRKPLWLTDPDNPRAFGGKRKIEFHPIERS